MTSPILPFNGPPSLAGPSYPTPFMSDAGDPAAFPRDAGDPAAFLRDVGDPAAFLRDVGDPAAFLRDVGDPAAFLRDVGDPTGSQPELNASDRLLASQDGSGPPPPEVLDQVAVAGRISRQMRESGHELRFSDGEGRRVTVELVDREGKTVKSMLISEALEIAAGGPSQDAAGKPLA
jgi:hypothetical protein